MTREAVEQVLCRYGICSHSTHLVTCWGTTRCAGGYGV